jgi:hypothetical protein
VVEHDVVYFVAEQLTKMHCTKVQRKCELDQVYDGAAILQFSDIPMTVQYVCSKEMNLVYMRGT